MGMVLVTGGSRGIGRATCIAFAKKGYDIAFCYSNDAEGAKETCRLVEREGSGVQCFQCDVSDENQVEKMFSSIFGLEILVNNAGRAMFGMIQETSLEQWNRLFAVNTTGTFLCTKYAIPKLLKRGHGSIVNVTSMWGEVGASCETAYSATKAALIGFTKAAAKELAPSNIRVNAVSCGMIQTKMNDCLSEEDCENFVSEIPIARQGTADEVAQAIVFLAEHKYMTGEILRVNGGVVI